MHEGSNAERQTPAGVFDSAKVAGRVAGQTPDNRLFFFIQILARCVPDTPAQGKPMPVGDTPMPPAKPRTLLCALFAMCIALSSDVHAAGKDAAPGPKTIRNVEQRLWQELQQRGLIKPILKQSTMAGVPHYMKRAGLGDHPEAYEALCPTVKLYARIAVHKTHNDVWLDIYPKFQPTKDSGLSDHFLKTMLSYVPSEQRKTPAWVALGLGDGMGRSWSEHFGRMQPGQRSTAIALQIWSAVTMEEKFALARHFFADQRELVQMGPPDQREFEPAFAEHHRVQVAKRAFVKAFEAALGRQELQFDVQGEYAGLLVRPRREPGLLELIKP